MKYFEPDCRWELYQVFSVEEYIKQFVVKGKFHKGVPEDIQDAWKTVEYLLAHAYYHWPMYDEGFKKALLNIEMAVKLKAKEKDISLKEEPTKAGMVFDKKLSKLIHEVFNGEYYQVLRNEIDRARNIRNFQVHPDRNTYTGPIGNIKGNLMFLINALNDIFRSNEEHMERYRRTVKLSEALKVFDKSLLVLDYHKPNILIEQILDFKIVSGKLYLFLNPVRTNISEILKHHYSLQPEVVCMDRYQMKVNEIQGTTPDGEEIRIYKTEKPENLKIFKDYQIQVAQADKLNWETCYSGLQHNTGWKKVKVEYDALVLQPTINEII